jgi:hypothetical protein
MLGVRTMERLCADCTGDFRDFVAGILKDHLETPPPRWLEKLLGAQA